MFQLFVSFLKIQSNVSVNWFAVHWLVGGWVYVVDVIDDIVVDVVRKTEQVT